MRNQTSSGTWAGMVLNKRCRGLPIAVANSQINIIMTQILTTGRDLLYTRYKGTLLGKESKLIRLFPVTVLLELDLTRLLDKVANMATACSKEIGATVTRDVVSTTGAASLNHLRNG